MTPESRRNLLACIFKSLLPRRTHRDNYLKPGAGYLIRPVGEVRHDSSRSGRYRIKQARNRLCCLRSLDPLDEKGFVCAEVPVALTEGV